jgi:thiamine-monophosphate kinase
VVEAAASRLVLKTDCVIENVHYRSEDPARKIGWKAAARVVSDFAAMGARPKHALVTFALAKSRSGQWASSVYRGIADCARRFGFSLAGGETSSTPVGSWLSISMTGPAPEVPLLRSGGNEGDRLLVTGRLGGSFASKRHLRFLPRREEGCWLAKRKGVTAMMDLSDGLAADLPRLASASGCGFRLRPESLPLHPWCDAVAAMADGEDYELLLAVSASRVNPVRNAWKRRFNLALTPVGELTAPGIAEGLEGAGYDHRADS